MPNEDPVARLIAVLALLVSFGNFVWSVYVGRRDSANIRVDVSQAFVNHPAQGPHGPYVVIHARNAGRRPVTLTEVGWLGRGIKIVFLPVDPGVLPKLAHDPHFPRELKEGEKHSCFALADFSDETRQTLGEIPLAYVADAVGRTYKAKIPYPTLQLIWPGGAYAPGWKVWAHTRWKWWRWKAA